MNAYTYNDFINIHNVLLPCSIAVMINKAIVPWIILMIVVIVLVTYIPAISLTLPKLMNLRF
ncbi:MAG: hypothetical protein KGZ94_11305 [Clostridia bacterium]|nr:hypothetical protein [Clostridia bacterium]